MTKATVKGIERRGDEKVLTIDQGGEPAELVADEILVGAGGLPNVTGLGLEKAGVDYDEMHGVKVDDRMRTTNRRIFAPGDVARASSSLNV